MKGGKTLDRMDATSRSRTNLVNNVVATLDYMDKMDDAVRNQIETKLYPAPGTKPVREQFLHKEDVKEESNEIKDIKNVLDVLGTKINKENDLNDPVDDNELDMTF